MKITINKNGEARKMKHDWHLVDWHQPTSVIAEQMGLSENQVSGSRRKYAPETVRIHYTKKCAMVDRVKDLDWSKTDWQLAKETGRSHGSLWKTRQKLAQMNVKEHAPLSAGASVDNGVDVKSTGEHVNRAADSGCSVSSCSPS